jgi:hypothetical protein
LKVFIAGQPKSGSTYLLGCLLRYFDAEYTMCNQWCSRGVEAQDVNRLLLDQGVHEEGNRVWKQHLLATPNNVGMLQGVPDWRPVPIIITARNIPDTLASYYDRCEEYAAHTQPSSNIDLDPFPMPIGMSFEQDWWKGTKEQKMDMLIRFFAPWIVLFHRGWSRVHENKKLRTAWVEYEDFMNQKLLMLKALVHWLKEEWDEEKGEKALAGTSTTETARKNKVIAGRGKEYLTKRQLDEIIRLEETF